MLYRNQALLNKLARKRGVAVGPNLAYTQSQLDSITRIIASGVEGAGYGDKRTDFRSLSDLRQIANAMQDEMDGGAGRMRQIRVVSPSDKGL
jgi:hypothetical protein